LLNKKLKIRNSHAQIHFCGDNSLARELAIKIYLDPNLLLLPNLLKLSGYRIEGNKNPIKEYPGWGVCCGDGGN
jgi:hypothetical protein